MLCATEASRSEGVALFGTSQGRPRAKRDRVGSWRKRQDHSVDRRASGEITDGEKNDTEPFSVAKLLILP